MLVGLSKPTSGTAMVAGHSITDDIVEVKRRVGVVPEVSNLYDELSVWDNLLFMSQIYHVPRHIRENRVREVLQSFDLLDRRTSKFGKLSKGLKRRTTIAAALIHNPEILFLDEPTVGLDVVSAQKLREYVARLGSQDTTVFLTTHYIEEADRLCDRIAILVEGKIVVLDTPEGIKKRVSSQSAIRVEFSREPDSSLVRELEGLGDVVVEERFVRLEAEQIGEPLRALIEIASRHDVSVESLESRGPSLEEAFVQLTGMSTDTLRAEKGGL
jgi:ABC-2 type transport system ATP-binding protein